MTPYLPTLHALLGAAGLAMTLVLFVALGAAVTARRSYPEIQLAAGWGLACLVLTTWAVITPMTLAMPVGVLAAAGGICLLHRPLRRRIGPSHGIPRLLLLSLPLWLVILPLRPSQIDTWLNLLPNAAYLFDFGMLPTDVRPPSYSLLPAAPYNTQFVAYIASLASGSFADAAMALFNVALLCASGMLFARVVSGRNEPPPWCACAAGLLLAIFLNPGFVPRVFFAPYGETPLTVTALFAVWLAVDMIDELARGVAWPRAMFAFAFVLVALVNTKQSAIGILLSIAVTTFVIALIHPRVPRLRGVVVVAVSVIPALVLYLIWRDFVLTNFASGELKPLPFSAWNFSLLPQIIGSILVEIFHKITFFLCLIGVLAASALWIRREPWSRTTVLLGMTAGVTMLFNAFLLFTYVAHFPPDMAAAAHSYFRYASQVSLLVMLGLTVALRPFVARWSTQLGPRVRYVAIAPTVLILVLPPAITGMLRFDLDAPQPIVWELGHQAARLVEPGDRLALLVPGDVNDSVGSMLRGVLMFTPPRRPRLDVKVETKADATTLASLGAAGYTLALVSCTPRGLDGIPPHAAAMLRYTGEGWRLLEAWPYPQDIEHLRFSALLARGPLCAAPESP